MKTDGWLYVIRRDRSPSPELCMLCGFDQLLVLLNSLPWHDIAWLWVHKRNLLKRNNVASFYPFVIRWDLKSFASSCECSGTEKVHNQITLDWLFIISSMRYIWGIRKNKKQISVVVLCTFIRSSCYKIFRLGINSTNAIHLEANVFLTFLPNEKWLKTWQWTLHVFNIMLQICTACVVTDRKSIDCQIVQFSVFHSSPLPHADYFQGSLSSRFSPRRCFVFRCCLIMFLSMLVLRQRVNRHEKTPW